MTRRKKSCFRHTSPPPPLPAPSFIPFFFTPTLASYATLTLCLLSLLLLSVYAAPLSLSLSLVFPLKDGNTALMDAIYYGHLDIAKMLVGLKPDVNAANKVSLKRGKEVKRLEKIEI